MKKFLESDVEERISKLESSDAVELARKVAFIQAQRRDYLRYLEDLESDGKRLMEKGVSLDDMSFAVELE